MKKLLSFILCLVLLISAGITAIAAPDAQDGALTERLTAITLKVKETLGIGDAFTSFSGNLNQSGTASLWSLSWSGDNEQIYVTANENGSVISYSHYVTSVSTPANSRIPRFPALSLEEAKSVANIFLNKVLDAKIASVDLTGSSTLDYSGSAMYHLNGLLKLHGVETPVYISVSVSAATKQVTSFYRGDSGQDYSGVTNPSAATDKTAAAAALKGTLNMKMTYALPGDGTRTARLQFLPNPDGNYVVDAATGKLVDLSKLDYSGDMTASPDKAAGGSASAAASAGITPVEQATIDKLQGVLTQSELEKMIRSYDELGLTADFKLQSVNYYTYEDANKVTQVTANLQFASSPATGDAQYRYITMDAKTGKVISVSGNIIYMTAKDAPPSYKFTSAQAEAVARSFAGKILPNELKLTALSGDATGPAYPDSLQYFMFYRTHESIVFPENYIGVAVDRNTGYVVNFYYSWYDYEVTFVSSAGAISADTAAAKFSEGAGVALQYVHVPVSVQPSGLMLAYTRADLNVWGVNALTGELLKAASAVDTGITYNDLAGNPYADIINKLALYGVGFPGGAFKPEAQLTQLDALILIESTGGRKVTPIPLVMDVMPAAGSAGGAKIAAPPISSGEIDSIYSIAYSMGILTPAEKEPAKLISRAEFVKYLVSTLGYGYVAVLPGIFKAGFKDDKSIPADLLGYVAIGKGLGIIRGDDLGRFKPNDISTRTMAAIMLYNCMSRK